jgi:hypothetical protein
MDPNFLLLCYLEKARGKTADYDGRYSVLSDALCDDECPAVRKLAATKNARIELICDVKDKHGDRFIRLSDAKVLSWLEAKVDAIAAKLISQSLAEAVVPTFKRDNAGETQGVDNSTLPSEASVKAPMATPSVGNGEREFAVGILSEYLNSEWTEMLAKHLGVRSPGDCAKDELTPKMRHMDNFKPDAPTKEDLSKKRKAEAALTTRGQQLLKKVDTRKMKSISSFFGKPKPKVK